MSREAWGRWGDDDERGALNLVGTAEVRAATALVRDGQVVSLAQPLGPKTPAAPHRGGMSRLMNRDGGDYAAGARRPAGFQFAEDTLFMPSHSGTHIDALAHVWYEDLLYNGHPGNSVRSTTGAGRCGVDKLTPIVARGVLLDAVELRGRRCRAGEALGVEETSAMCAGLALAPGDVVLLRTGWIEVDHARPDDYFAAEPGFDAAAGVWLAEHGIAALGADNYAVEVQPGADEGFPLHRRLLRDFGVPLLEGLVLDGLAATGRRTFLFVAAALPLAGSTASPIHPIGVL